MTSRKILAKWLCQFASLNIILLFLMSLCFLYLIPRSVSALIQLSGQSSVIYGFISLGLISQIGMLGLLVTLFLFLVILIYPQKRMIQLFAPLLMTALVFLVGLDFVTYQFIGYHLTGTFWHVLFSGAFHQVIVLSWVEWLVILVGVLLAFIVELVLLYWSERRSWKRSKTFFEILVSFVFVGVVFTYTFYFSNFINGRVVPQVVVVIPYFDWASHRVENKPVSADAELNYPLHTLHFDHSIKPLNILLIVIDTWRADMLNEVLTPNIARFAQESWRFTNHFSGGNFTRPGVFSAFYGLSPNYWHYMESHKQGPMLIQQLLRDHYSIDVFASASLRFPDFINTVFEQVPAAWHDTRGVDSTQRDRVITREFERFLSKRNTKQPFFSFLFYDEVHNWCGSSQHFAHPFQPAIKTCNRIVMGPTTNPIPYLNRYKNAIHFDDRLIGDVIVQLKAHDLLKNTVVIITADHGEEFNDSGLGLWGHGSAFNRYQLEVPFLLYWPDTQPHSVGIRTSHYDIVPTLMQNALGCLNPSSDYSMGHSLFIQDNQPFLVVGSYNNYAAVLARMVVMFYPGGYFLIDDLSGHPLDKIKFSQSMVARIKEKLRHQMRRFF